MKTEKRYVVTIDMYVHAEDDYTARKKAHQITKAIDVECNRWDLLPDVQNPKVNGIGEQPFASFSYRALEEISNPKEAEKEMPF